MSVKGRTEIILRIALLRWLWGTDGIDLSSIMICERGTGCILEVHGTPVYAVNETHFHWYFYLSEIYTYDIYQ